VVGQNGVQGWEKREKEENEFDPLEKAPEEGKTDARRQRKVCRRVGVRSVPWARSPSRKTEVAPVLRWRPRHVRRAHMVVARGKFFLPACSGAAG